MRQRILKHISEGTLQKTPYDTTHNLLLLSLTYLNQFFMISSKNCNNLFLEKIAFSVSLTFLLLCKLLEFRIVFQEINENLNLLKNRDTQFSSLFVFCLRCEILRPLLLIDSQINKLKRKQISIWFLYSLESSSRRVLWGGSQCPRDPGYRLHHWHGVIVWMMGGWGHGTSWSCQWPILPRALGPPCLL